MAPSSVVGLDIGTYQMKAVELQPSSKEGLTITNLAVAPTPPGIIQNGIITDPRVMGHSVKQMLKDAGIRTKRIVASVAGQSSVVVRIIEVPKMSAQELAETMKWEVERHVPFAPSEVQMDYVALPSFDTGDENPNMAVLLAVAQNDMINNYVEMLYAAGLDPIALDIEPLAAGRALLDLLDAHPVVRQFPPPVIEDEEGNFVSQEETVAIVNIGASNTDISIFENDQLIFPRSLSLAGDSITRQISESLGYTNDQAEQMKREHGGVMLERAENYPEGGPSAQESAEPEPVNEFENFRPSGLPDTEADSLMSSPFDVDEATEEITAATGASTDENATSTTEDLERTQPIPRRSIDLARRTPPPEAPNLLSGFDGGDESMRVQVFDAISPVLMELSTELRRSLEYYRSRSQGSNVHRILLAGGTASMPDLGEYLSRELQVPVEVANPFTQLNVSTKNYDADYITSIGPLFTIAVGLAVREAVFAANPQTAPAPVAAPKPEGGSKFKLPFSLGKKEKTGSTTGEPTLPPG